VWTIAIYKHFNIYKEELFNKNIDWSSSKVTGGNIHDYCMNESITHPYFNPETVTPKQKPEPKPDTPADTTPETALSKLNTGDPKEQLTGKKKTRKIVITAETLKILWESLEIDDTPDHWRRWDATNRDKYHLSEQESLIYFIYDSDKKISDVQVGNCLGGANREAIQSAHKRAKGKVEMHGTQYTAETRRRSSIRR